MPKAPFVSCTFILIFSSDPFVRETALVFPAPLIPPKFIVNGSVVCVVSICMFMFE